MPFRYSAAGLILLNAADSRIQQVFHGLILIRDCKILETFRGHLRQDEMFTVGTSKLEWPNSKHNTVPSLAIDAVPWPFHTEDWENREFWVEWISWVKGFASGIGVSLISGFDWDNDYDLADQKFYDGPHFEVALEMDEL